MTKEINLKKIREIQNKIPRMKKLVREIKRLDALKNEKNKEQIETQIIDMKERIREINNYSKENLKSISLRQKQNNYKKNFKSKGLEKSAITRTPSNKKKKTKIKRDNYSKIASRLFSGLSIKLVKKGYFKNLENDMVKSHLKYTLPGYTSIIMLSTLLSFFAGILIFLFLSFYKIEATLPIIEPVKDISTRMIKLAWLMILVPLGGFLFAYFYPSLEKKSIEKKIDNELPFATINMSAISGSMIDPVKIFEIIVSTEEFPHIKKELTKILNEINIYGYDIVSSLRHASFNSPSKKLSELFNGMANTINSGGDLTKFFDKRSESLMFDYKINREKETKTAETFMDLYISIVIAAPMIFMLLLIMMKISGLGVALSTSSITLIMVLSVVAINIFFLIFLHLKKGKQ